MSCSPRVCRFFFSTVQVCQNVLQDIDVVAMLQYLPFE